MRDRDGDGIPNRLDSDRDGNGIPNALERGRGGGDGGGRRGIELPGNTNRK